MKEINTNYTPQAGKNLEGGWTGAKPPNVTIKTPPKPNTGGNSGNSSGNRT
ncbi:MAG: hypothetical protein IJS08_12275 [Victivallales bacterium]|nr:hypothetical protein [Victivallales bacterium]